MAKIPETIINVVALQGMVLNLTSGDTLAVMVPQILSSVQRLCLSDALDHALPEGVKALIFDGGITIAAVSAKHIGSGIPSIPMPSPSRAR